MGDETVADTLILMMGINGHASFCPSYDPLCTMSSLAAEDVDRGFEAGAIEFKHRNLLGNVSGGAVGPAIVGHGI